MTQMSGMTALVTGASRGLGRAIAVEYARQGARVVVCARGRSPTGLPDTAEATVQQIREAAGEAQVNAMVARTVEEYSGIDVLVNNAGAMVLGETLLEIGPEKWDQSMAANVRGPHLL